MRSYSTLALAVASMAGLLSSSPAALPVRGVGAIDKSPPFRRSRNQAPTVHYGRNGRVHLNSAGQHYGQSGNKLARKAAEGRLGLATLR